jgi:hypothetical protein
VSAPVQADFGAAAGWRTGSTQINFASCSLIASRALQIWQMKFVWFASSRMI